MARVTTNLTVTSGIDFTKIWKRYTRDSDGDLVPIPMTGWTGVCQVRERPGSSGYLLVPSLPVTLGATDGSVTLKIPGATSWTWKWTKGFYGLLLTHPTQDDVDFADGILTVRQGSVYVS